MSFATRPRLAATPEQEAAIIAAHARSAPRVGLRIEESVSFIKYLRGYGGDPTAPVLAGILERHRAIITQPYDPTVFAAAHPDLFCKFTPDDRRAGLRAFGWHYWDWWEAMHGQPQPVRVSTVRLRPLGRARPLRSW
jgi:hypothetical protein